MRFHILMLGAVMGLASCGLTPRQSGGDILVIGDSVMAWNGGSGGDVGDVLAEKLQRPVVNRAVLGARLGASGPASLLGLAIPAQLPKGRWTWVVMNGGANDLASSCGCASCDDEINSLISADGSRGEIPDLITQARSQGAQVLWMGYYDAPQSASFKNCRPALVELERRVADYAQSRSGVYFVDSEDVIDAGDMALYAADKSHPSPKGSALIGTFLAQKISGLSQP